MVYDKLKEKAVFHVATSSDVGNRAGGKRPHVWFAPLIVGHIIIMSEEKSLQNDTVIGERVVTAFESECVTLNFLCVGATAFRPSGVACTPGCTGEAFG